MDKKKVVNENPLMADTATLEALHEYGEMQYTIEEAAAALKVHVNTLRDFLRREPRAAEAFERGKLCGKVQLREAAFRMAEEDPRMIRFLSKIYLGMSD